MNEIQYIKRHNKYTLTDYLVKVDERIPTPIFQIPYISVAHTVNEETTMTLLIGYTWNGPSGPVFTKNKLLYASAFHDAFYEMIKNQAYLSQHSIKELADEIFYNDLIESGVSKIRAWYMYKAVSKYGKYYL